MKLTDIISKEILREMGSSREKELGERLVKAYEELNK